MARIEVGTKDVAWNYVGTITSMASNFVLLPILLAFLSSDEIGLWYVFLALAGFAQLFEFGFTGTFSRHIVYCVSGARELSSSGLDTSHVQEGVDWHLLRVVLRTSKLIYALFAIVALVGFATLGTLYLQSITQHIEGSSHWVAWAFFLVAIFLNLYYLNYLAMLRGLGDIAAENKAKTAGRLSQLLVSAVLLFAGLGIIGAAVGFMVNCLVLRLVSLRAYYTHRDILAGIQSDTTPVHGSEVTALLRTVIPVTWRDGVVSLAWFASTQATSIICSLFFTLAETGTYSILMQLSNAAHNMSFAYSRTYLPSYQSAFADNDKQRQRELVERGLSQYLVLYWLASAGIVLVIFSLLPLFKPGLQLSIPLFLGISLYMYLYHQHSYFCNLILGTNRIPYFWGYLLSSLAGIVLSVVFIRVFHLGLWSLVLGPALPHLLYNNWRWPKFVLDELNTTYDQVLANGFAYWMRRFQALRQG